MKDVKQIKQELQAFDIKYNTIDGSLKAIKGNTLIELFNNISTYIDCYKITIEKTKEFNSIFNNKLVIEDGVLLYNCTGLKSITIPDSVTSIRERAFEGCIELTSVTIPNSVTTIGEWAFAFCRRLKTITIPNSVTSIGSYAFYGCNKNLKIIKI